MVALALAGCEPTEAEVLSRLGTVEGRFDTVEGIGGSAYVFLYRPNEGPPTGPGVPAFLTAISAGRLKTDPRFVFANVKPNPWSLYGLLDTTGHFDPESSDCTHDWAALAKMSTLVVYMGLRHLDAIAAKLIDAGLDPFTPAAVIANATLPNQIVIDSPLSLIAGLFRFVLSSCLKSQIQISNRHCSNNWVGS